MAGNGTRRGVHNLEKSVTPVVVAPCNAREYRSWLRELTTQLGEMLGYGDRLVDMGVMTREEQGREKLEGIVVDLQEFLHEKHIELLKKAASR